MYANVYTTSLRDRGSTVLAAVVAVGLMLLLGMAAYSGIDTSFYYELPEAMLNAAGISAEVGGVGGIAYGAIYNLMGAMTMAGMAISIGASSIAGEERDGTLGLLLGNPRSRRSVLVSKVGSLVTLVVAGGLVLYGAGLLVPAILSVEIAGVQVFALTLHLIMNALFWGMLAVAVGAWTGNRGLGSGVAAGAMVLSWLAASFLPMISATSGLAKISPWYYFSGSQPEVNGIAWGHIAVLAGLSLIAAAVAWIGVDRRDLRGASTATTMIDRLRANPRTQKIAERFAGSTRVTSVMTKTVSDHQGLVAAGAIALFYLGALLTPFYNLLPEAFTTAMGDLPDAMVAAIGGVDMSTPVGWLQGEIFSIVVPIVIIGVLAVVGSRALGGEEENHTMGLLLANPVSRSRIVTEKVAAMVIYAVVLGIVTFAAVTLGVVLGGLDVAISGVAVTSLLAALLGLVYGGVALMLSAATGRVKVAVGGAAGLGLLSYVAQSFLPLNDSLAGWAKLSPFHWFLGSNPLTNGLDWTSVGILLGIFAVLVALSYPLFNRRDLRG